MNYKTILGSLIIMFIIGLISISFIVSKINKPVRPVYSVYIIWDNMITQNDTTGKVDSSLYIFDKKLGNKLIVNRIQ